MSAFSINQAHIVGNIVSAPRFPIRSLSENRHVFNFSIATNQNWTNSDGTPGQQTQFHNISFINNPNYVKTVFPHIQKGVAATAIGLIKYKAEDVVLQDGSTKRIYYTNIEITGMDGTKLIVHDRPVKTTGAVVPPQPTDEEVAQAAAEAGVTEADIAAADAAAKADADGAPF